MIASLMKIVDHIIQCFTLQIQKLNPFNNTNRTNTSHKNKPKEMSIEQK